VSLEVSIRQEARKSLALRVTPDGLLALIPRTVDPDSRQVREFIRRGLAKIQLPAPLPKSEHLAPDDLHQLVARWAERIGVEVGRVQIRRMHTKWASCSSRGNVTLNRLLLQIPRELVEYVICHELVHLKVPGHGKGWQMLMGLYMHDWQERERELAAWSLVVG